MASTLFGQGPGPNPPRQQMASNPASMMGNLRRFAGMIRGRGDPQQLVQAYMRQNGIGQQQLDQAMQHAQEIAQMMGLK